MNYVMHGTQRERGFPCQSLEAGRRHFSLPATPSPECSVQITDVLSLQLLVLSWFVCTCRGLAFPLEKPLAIAKEPFQREEMFLPSLPLRSAFQFVCLGCLSNIWIVQPSSLLFLVRINLLHGLAGTKKNQHEECIYL